MNDKTLDNVHWSFWLVAAVGLVFNLMGCFNYVSQMNADSLAAMPEIYRAIADARPAWGTGAFALAVFGGLFGCIFLLLRKAVALYVFVLALVATIVAQVPFLGMDDFPAEAWVGWLSQVLVGAFLTWYSRRAASKGLIA